MVEPPPSSTAHHLLSTTRKCHEAARAYLESPAGVRQKLAMRCRNSKTLSCCRVHISHPCAQKYGRRAAVIVSRLAVPFPGPCKREALSDKGRAIRITPHCST